MPGECSGGELVGRYMGARAGSARGAISYLSRRRLAEPNQHRDPELHGNRRPGARLQGGEILLEMREGQAQAGGAFTSAFHDELLARNMPLECAERMRHGRRRARKWTARCTVRWSVRGPRTVVRI